MTNSHTNRLHSNTSTSKGAKYRNYSSMKCLRLIFRNQWRYRHYENTSGVWGTVSPGVSYWNCCVVNIGNVIQPCSNIVPVNFWIMVTWSGVKLKYSCILRRALSGFTNCYQCVQ